MRLFVTGAAIFFSAMAVQLHATGSSSSATGATAQSSVKGNASSSVTPAPTPAASGQALSATAGSAAAVSATPLASAKALKDGAKTLSPTAQAPLNTYRPPHRYPALAESLAVFPGVVVHGAGHMYAGSWMKGIGLFLLEGASVWLDYSAYNEYKRGAYYGLKFSGNSIPNLGGAESEVGILMVANLGFLFTWFDDMGGAPLAAGEFNRIHEHDQGLSLHLLPVQNGAALALSSTF
jgi:hypothetical protein